MINGSVNIISHFLAAAESFPANMAIVHNGQSIAYAGLKRKVVEKAAYFTSQGIRPGDRVLVFVPMGIELYVNVLALFYMGAVALFIDEWVSRERLALCCRLAKCKGFIAPLKLRLLAYTSRTLRAIPVWLKPGKGLKGHADSFYTARENDTALVTFTTGSTGVPKAANRTHAFLQAQFDALADKIKPGPTDVDMVTLPVVLLLNLGAGATSVIPNHKAAKPEKTDMAAIVKLVWQYRVNRIESSPYFVKRLAQYVTDNNLNLQTPEKIFTGGAPVFPDEADLYMKAFPTAQVEIVYGSTEAEPVSAIAASELAQKYADAQKGLCVGKPYHGTQVKIIPVTDNNLNFASAEALDKTVLPAGQTGEIIVSGAHVLRAYIENPEAMQRNKIVTGENCWHRTGDSGWLDDSGNLYLTGRCSGLVVKDGKLLSPFIYEYILRTACQVSMGTMIQHDRKIKIVAEGKPGNEKRILEKLKDKGLYADEVHMLAKMPRDPRHYTKIEYGKLGDLLKKDL